MHIMLTRHIPVELAIDCKTFPSNFNQDLHINEFCIL